MGFFKKIGRAFRSVGRSITRVTKRVFKGTVLKVASKALGFVRGLNVKGIVHKAFSFLGKGAKILNFMKAGFHAFRALVGKFNLSHLVKSLTTLPFQPLGHLFSKLGGVARSIGQVLGRLNPFMPQLQLARSLLGGIMKNITPWRALGDAVLTPELNALFSALPQLTPMDPGFDLPMEAFLFPNSLLHIDQRMRNIAEMLDQVMFLTGQTTQPEGQVIIR